MSGALNPSSGVNRFHHASAAGAAAAGGTAPAFGAPASTECGSAAAFLDITNAAAAAAAAADFAYDFGLGFHHRHHHHHPAAPPHHSAGFGYFSPSEVSESYASLAWEAQNALAYSQGQAAGAPFGTPCDFGPFSLSSARLHPTMGVQRIGPTTRGGIGNCGNGVNGVSSAPKTTKTRRRVATIAQRRAANIRERRRMFNLNSAFDKLRKKVPTFAYEKRLSRIETLRLAIMYIAFMTEVIRGGPRDPSDMTSAAYDGHLWTTSSPHHPSPLTDTTQRPDRLAHICSRQV